MREEEAQAFAAKHGLEFLETSAFDSTNIAQAFTDVLGKICKVVQGKDPRKGGGQKLGMKTQRTAREEEESISFGNVSMHKKKEGCCYG